MRTTLWTMYTWRSGYQQYRPLDDAAEVYPTCEHCLEIVTKDGIETADGDAVHLECYYANYQVDVPDGTICPGCNKPIRDGEGYQHGEDVLCRECVVSCNFIPEYRLPDHKEIAGEIDSCPEYDAWDFREDY